jgi:hypothetical protein
VKGNAVSVSGKFKQFFNTGTVHGTYTLAGSTQTGTLKGSATYSGGTGAYAGAAGHATIGCKSAANSTVSTCAASSTLTKL